MKEKIQEIITKPIEDINIEEKNKLLQVYDAQLPLDTLKKVWIGEGVFTAVTFTLLSLLVSPFVAFFTVLPTFVISSMMIPVAFNTNEDRLTELKLTKQEFKNMKKAGVLKEIKTILKKFKGLQTETFKINSSAKYTKNCICENDEDYETLHIQEELERLNDEEQSLIRRLAQIKREKEELASKDTTIFEEEMNIEDIEPELEK